MTFPESEKTRKELFDLLGTMGGTYHQIPEHLREIKRTPKMIKFAINKKYIGTITRNHVTIYDISQWDDAFGEPFVNRVSVYYGLKDLLIQYFGIK